MKWYLQMLQKHLQEDPKKQKHYYTGTIKIQIAIDKKTSKVICTNFENGKQHDFRLFKESKLHCHANIKILTDIGYQ